MRTLNFSTKQKGYGRQGLYFNFDRKTYHIQDVFPNVAEHFSDFELLEDTFFDEETEIYKDLNGREVTPIDSWDEFLFDNFKEEIGQILYENLNHEDYEDYNFDDATYEEIAEWAINY